MSRTILIAEDEATQRLTLTDMLEREGYRVIETKNGAEALHYLKRDDAAELIDLVLTDLNMPEMDGLALITNAKTLLPDLPIIVLTMSTDLEDAVACIRAGAYDFIPKPVQPARLKISIENTFAAKEMRTEIKRLTRAARGDAGFDSLIGHDKGLKNAVAIGKKLAASDLPVLITGESGVGKEAFARALHSESKRTGKPFVAINCGAIPQNLAESVLFGHEKGAFTGAIAKSLGKFREAQGGTLFLDEIGELPPETQAKLLRALQNKEIEPVGLSSSVKVDVRIISATHRDLHDDVENGAFREDLFYRLNVLPAHIPALRERTQDIEPLIDYFSARLCAREGIAPRNFVDSALTHMRSYAWPGNVRELENCVSRALLLASGETITAEEIAPLLRTARVSELATNAPDNVIALNDAQGGRKTMDDLEREIIEKTMQFYEDYVPKAAAALNIGQSTLYRKLSQQS